MYYFNFSNRRYQRLKKMAGFAMTDIWREKMIGRQISFFILISEERGII